MDEPGILGWLGLGLSTAGILGLAVGILLLRDRRRAGGEGGGRAEPPAASGSPPWLWLVVIAGLATIIFLSRPAARRGAPRPPAPPMAPMTWAGILLGCLATAAAVALAVAYERRPRPERASPRSKGKSTWVGLAALLLAAVAAWRYPRVGPVLPLVGLGWLVGHVGGLFLAVRWWNDREVLRILRRAEEIGDPDAALAEIRALIEARGPTPARLNVLGVLQSVRDDWEGAYQTFLELERVAGRDPLVLTNLGASLAKLGRPDEAVATFEELVSKEPHDSAARLRLASALADAGRPEEARAQLTRVEQARHRFIGPNARALNELRAREIDELRGRLDAAGGPAKKDVTGLEEL